MLRGDTYKLSGTLQDSLNTQDKNWGWKVVKFGTRHREEGYFCEGISVVGVSRVGMWEREVTRVSRGELKLSG